MFISSYLVQILDTIYISLKEKLNLNSLPVTFLHVQLNTDFKALEVKAS